VDGFFFVVSITVSFVPPLAVCPPTISKLSRKSKLSDRDALRLISDSLLCQTMQLIPATTKPERRIEQERGQAAA
jgi:hypothetical protein